MTLPVNPSTTEVRPLSTQPFTTDDLRGILAHHAGVAECDLPDDPDTPFTDLGLDSLAIVAVQYGVEQRCDIEVPDADACHFTSPASVVNYVNERVALARS
jgi:minimal PKS acyl carrier protein